jgi:tetratricopeptide (TPR) repeat protein
VRLLPAPSAVSRLLRDLRDPQRLQRNALYRQLAQPFDDPAGGSLRRSIVVQLQRLSPRRRAILIRYELNGEPLEPVAADLGLSRRQFFRDRRAGLGALAELLTTNSREPSLAPTALPRAVEFGAERASLLQSVIAGLRHAGEVNAALARLRDLAGSAPARSVRRDALLQTAEIARDYGDRATARRVLAELAGAGMLEGQWDTVTAARIMMIESDLAADCDLAIGLNERAAYELTQSLHSEASSPALLLLVECLCMLSHDYERASRNGEAMDAASRAVELVERARLDTLPAGVAARVALAYQRARQFSDVGAVLATLREPLARSLAAGWFTLAAQIGVACLSLSVTRSRYGDALRWYDWLSSVSADRFPAFERKTLVYDGAHALVMMRHARGAIAALDGSRDEGYVYVPSVKIRRAEALEALGDVRGAIEDATAALAGSERAHYVKGIARAKRVLASCYAATGQGRLARTQIAECIGLTEPSQSPYDLLRARVTQAHVLRDERVQATAIELARLLLEAGGTEPCTPPSQALAG